MTAMSDQERRRRALYVACRRLNGAHLADIAAELGLSKQGLSQWLRDWRARERRLEQLRELGLKVPETY